MRLEEWNDSVEFFRVTCDLLDETHGIDFKLRLQVPDSVRSISSNVAGGYYRKSIKEYVQFLHITLGSAGESLMTMISLMHSGHLPPHAFENFDSLRYASEN